MIFRKAEERECVDDRRASSSFSDSFLVQAMGRFGRELVNRALELMVAQRRWIRCPTRCRIDLVEAITTLAQPQGVCRRRARRRRRTQCSGVRIKEPASSLGAGRQSGVHVSENAHPADRAHLR